MHPEGVPNLKKGFLTAMKKFGTYFFMQLRQPSGQSSTLLPTTGWFSPSRQKSTTWNIRRLQLLFIVKPAHHLIYGNICLDTNKLKMHPIVVPTHKFFFLNGHAKKCQPKRMQGNIYIRPLIVHRVTESWHFHSLFGCVKFFHTHF